MGLVLNYGYSLHFIFQVFKFNLVVVGFIFHVLRVFGVGEVVLCFVAVYFVYLLQILDLQFSDFLDAVFASSLRVWVHNLFLRCCFVFEFRRLYLWCLYVVRLYAELGLFVLMD